MVKMGGSASLPHLTAFQGLERLFRARGIDLDWVLYSDYDSMVDAFVSGEIDLAWNGPLGYVKIKRRLDEPCRVIAMRDVDINCITHFITQPQSDITTAEDLKDKSFAFGRRASEQGGLLPYRFLKQLGIDPRRDLSEASFFEDRPPGNRSHERDVVERVVSGGFSAGAVSQQTLEAMAEDGSLQPGTGADFLVQSRLQPLLFYGTAIHRSGSLPRNPGRPVIRELHRPGRPGCSGGRRMRELCGWHGDRVGDFGRSRGSGRFGLNDCVQSRLVKQSHAWSDSSGRFCRISCNVRSS